MQEKIREAVEQALNNHEHETETFTLTERVEKLEEKNTKLQNFSIFSFIVFMLLIFLLADYIFDKIINRIDSLENYVSNFKIKSIKAKVKKVEKDR